MINLKKELQESVTVAVMSPDGILFVRDLLFSEDALQKFPGGGVKDGETPRVAGVREVYEETGVELEEEDLVLVHKERRESPLEHWHYFFVVKIEFSFEEKGLQEFGPVTGEKTNVIPLDSSVLELELNSQFGIILELMKGL